MPGLEGGVHITVIPVDNARAYLERSKPLPVKLSLSTAAAPSYYHSIFVIIPRAIGRLRSLSIRALQGDLQDFTAPYHLTLLLLLRSCPYVVIPMTSHSISQRSHPHSPTEISLRYASCAWSAFPPSYIGETWSISHRSCWFTRCLVKPPSSISLTSSQALLTSATATSISQPQPPVLKMTGLCH